LIRDLELVKNILVKDFQTFMDHIFLVNEKSDPLFSNLLPVIRGQLWRHLRTNLTTVFTSHKMKLMFYLVDTCGKELADFLEKATAGGKLTHDLCSYKFHSEYKFQKLEQCKGYIYIYTYVYNEYLQYHPTVYSDFS